MINRYGYHCPVPQKEVTNRGTLQRVIEYKTKIIIAQKSEVYMVEIVRLIRPVKTLA
jgi:hypothetical protein